MGAVQQAALGKGKMLLFQMLQRPGATSDWMECIVSQLITQARTAPAAGNPGILCHSIQGTASQGFKTKSI